VVEFEKGLKLYHAGDTAVFGDMRLIHELYGPELIMLPIGDLFTMGPKEAAMACRFLQPKTVIPMHYGTFPLLTGTPNEFKRLSADLGIEVIAMQPGQTI
jgi:L-ascorbate metabolism protein UlaG (beta-lactamase superfamily)